MLLPKDNVVPPGGFHFMEGTHRIDGHSYVSVAENLMRYRVDNKIDVGNPVGEVLDYVCSKHPHYCHEAPAQSNIPLPLASRVAQWVAKLYAVLRGQKVETLFVDQKIANERAAICSGCPNNQSWAGGCGTCARDTRRISYTFRGGRSTKTPNELLGCQVLGHDNATAVWLKTAPTVDPTAYEQLPDFCWRRTTLKSLAAGAA